jgi:hypothetical protein
MASVTIDSSMAAIKAAILIKGLFRPQEAGVVSCGGSVFEGKVECLKKP